MKNIMKYKGYWARIQYSDEDECFWGEIEGLKNDCITFEGRTVEELKKDFQEAIEHYLEVCKETNSKPEKQCKGSLNIRLGVELHNKAKMKFTVEIKDIKQLQKALNLLHTVDGVIAVRRG